MTISKKLFVGGRLRLFVWFVSGLVAISHHGLCLANHKSEQPERQKFRTLFVTRSLGHERLIPYLKTAKPEIVQIGNYGAMFHGFADHQNSTRSPMLLPVQGERAALKFQKALNEKVHAMGLTVVGHFRLIKVMADWEAKTGFVEYYNKRWPEDLLGPKPHPDLKELLQRDATGAPIQVSRYDKGQLTLCLSSPYARKMLKQMLKCAIDHGVDGVMTNYNYRYDCACPHCQEAFKSWLEKRLTADELHDKLGVTNLKEHRFESIPARIPGYPDVSAATELDWLAINWGAEHFKRMFDDIFLDYGRSLRKDLVVGQWNHLSHVSLKEERMFVPLDLWGSGEDYFWYSGGASFVGKRLNLKEGRAGDAWLSCLYVREMSGRKPFVMGKYDGIRMAASMAEGFATGGLGMGRYMRFEDPVAFEVLARYTNFMHEHRGLFDGARPWSEAALVLPRQTILGRHPEALDAFRELGQALIEKQLLLDVVVDQKLSSKRLAEYPAIILPKAMVLNDEQLVMLREYSSAGGTIFTLGETGTLSETGQIRSGVDIGGKKVVSDGTLKNVAGTMVDELQKFGATKIETPWTVRVAAYRQPGQFLLHLVNYDRNETPDKSLTAPALERPIAASDIAVSFRLPVGFDVRTVMLIAPDRGEALKLEFKKEGGHIRFNVPRVLVYAVVKIEG